MTLTDTGPIIALINRNDPNHAQCIAAARQLPAGPLLTTWPCFTEAMYLMFRAGGHLGQQALWELHVNGRLVLDELTANDMERMRQLMAKYRDRPMDLADASLVAAAERLRTHLVFSLDSDFRVYRMTNGTPFQIIP